MYSVKSILMRTALLMGVVVFLSACTKKYTKEEIENLFEPIASKYGVKIVYEIGDDFLSSVTTIGPSPGPAQHSKVKRIDDHDLVKYPSLLQLAMEKYPIQVLKNRLKAIHFAKEIDQDGHRFGGSYDPYRKVMYLVHDGRQDDDYSIKTFHHEFSSLLLKSQGLLLNPWLEQNPTDFVYLAKILKYEDWKKVEIKLEGSKAEYEQGFVTDYGRTSFENDFNEYAAMIFTHPQKFKKIMNQYPRVRGKFLVLLAFYHEIDPVFTEAYFLGKG